MEDKNFRKPEYYVNRELSWLLFNRRVLSEARDKTIPLFERLKFLSITSSNLDEFFMVRVASLKDQVHAQYTKTDIAGLTPKEQLKRISEDTHELVQLQYSTYNRSVYPALKKKAGLSLITQHEDLTKAQKKYVDEYFEEDISEHRRADLKKRPEKGKRDLGVCYCTGAFRAPAADPSAGG